MLEPTRAELLDQITSLRAQLSTLPAIEQAKGALMAVYGLTAEAAFALLRWHSQHSNVKVQSIAAGLTTGPLTGPISKPAAARLDQLMSDITDSMRSARASTGPAQTPPSLLPGSPLAAPAKSEQADLAPRPDELPGLLLRAVDGATHGVTIAANSADRPLVYANDAFLRLTGFPVEQVMGHNCRFLQGVDTDPVDTAAIVDAINAGRDISRIIRNYRHDGTAFWNEVTISAVRDPATGGISHYLGTQIAVTDPPGRDHQAHAARPAGDRGTGE